jgi:hypothetical protein
MMKPPVLMITVGVAVLGTCLFLMFHGSSTKAIPQVSAPSTKPFDVASGDTNNEVLKSIVARQKTLQDENKALQLENKKLTEAKSQSEKSELSQTAKSLADQIQSTKSELESELNSALNGMRGSANQPGFGEGLGSAVITEVPDLQEKEPELSPDLVKKKLTEEKNFLPPKKNAVTPFYTLPALSTVANAVLLSPLIGEVPVNGQLESPAFPFKAMISPKDVEIMFSANGIPLPSEVSGAVLEGYSVGNMSLGCARAYVMRLLFVFEDGHYVVYPDDGKMLEGATELYPKSAIGYLSDRYNNPCMTGTYITDAPKVIASLSTLGAAGGAGEAVASSQMETFSNISQGTTGSFLNGSLGKYAAGQAVGEASKAALDWYKSRINDIFDAVFIPSTENGLPRELVFNVTKTIPIDLNQHGRKLDEHTTLSVTPVDHSFE